MTFKNGFNPRFCVCLKDTFFPSPINMDALEKSSQCDIFHTKLHSTTSVFPQTLPLCYTAVRRHAKQKGGVMSEKGHHLLVDFKFTLKTSIISMQPPIVHQGLHTVVY